MNIIFTSTSLIVIPFVLGLTTAFFLIKQVKSMKLGIDSSIGVQKTHHLPTSRLGGVAVVVATISGVLTLYSIDSKLTSLFSNLVFCASPVFFAGLLEDVTHKVSPSWRLICAVFSAVLVIYSCGAKVLRTDFFLVDLLLRWESIVIIVSIIVIAGFTNAINMIDGFHGLALTQVMLIQFFIGLMSWDAKQFDIYYASLIIYVSSLSLLVLNWPRGRIFLGDGGAYFLGFVTVSLGLIFLYRIPSVSPLCLIVLGSYPLIDATFSIYRRLIIRHQSASSPDHLHMHSLIFRRFIKQNWRSFPKSYVIIFGQSNNANYQNAAVGLFLFVFIFSVDCLAWYFKSNAVVLGLILVTLLTAYLYIFKLFCQFKIKKIFK